jgi:YgiT-type zinc finger domain-containing protein
MIKPDKCVSCGGNRLVERRVTRSFGRRMDDLIVVQRLPVVVCRDCGETLISGTALKTVEAMRRNRSKLRKVGIPVGHI